MFWFERYPARLAAERDVMRSRFPGFTLIEAEGGDLCWVGILEPVAGREFVLAVSYPDRYPYEEPRIYVLDPPLQPGTPHVYENGALCVHPAGRWDPSRTVAGSLALASAWLVMYVTWERGGEGF